MRSQLYLVGRRQRLVRWHVVARMHVGGMSRWHRLPMGAVAMAHHGWEGAARKVVAAVAVVVRHVAWRFGHPRRVGEWAVAMLVTVGRLVGMEGPAGPRCPGRWHVLPVRPVAEVGRFCSKLGCCSCHCQPEKHNQEECFRHVRDSRSSAGRVRYTDDQRVLAGNSHMFRGGGQMAPFIAFGSSHVRCFSHLQQ